MDNRKRWSQTTDYRDLDALVLEELKAATVHRSPPQHRPVHDEPPADAFEAVDAQDEDSFLERTADFLKGRPDAEELLEAVRRMLVETDDTPAGPPDAGAELQDSPHEREDGP